MREKARAKFNLRNVVEFDSDSGRTLGKITSISRHWENVYYSLRRFNGDLESEVPQNKIHYTISYRNSQNEYNR